MRPGGLEVGGPWPGGVRVGVGVKDIAATIVAVRAGAVVRAEEDSATTEAERRMGGVDVGVDVGVAVNAGDGVEFGWRFLLSASVGSCIGCGVGAMRVKVKMDSGGISSPKGRPKGAASSGDTTWKISVLKSFLSPLAGR